MVDGTPSRHRQLIDRRDTAHLQQLGLVVVWGFEGMGRYD